MICFCKFVVYRFHKIRFNKEQGGIDMKQMVCSVCGYVYDREDAFDQLGPDFKCPVCGVSKDKFIEEDVEESHEW